MTRISDLSQDLIEEILSRVPLTSQRAVQSTCKQWNALYKDESFTKKHLGKQANNDMVIMVRDSRVCLVSLDLQGVFKKRQSLVELSKKLIGQLNHITVSDVYHCDGLLFCLSKNDIPLVWNPYSGQVRWIKPRRKLITSDSYRYCMGYDNKNNHKILRLLHSCSTVQYEIYDFKSDSWRVLHLTPDWIIPYKSQGGLSLKGNTYFVTQRVKKVEMRESLICFDFTSERFRHCLDLELNYRNGDSVILSAVREDQLAVLFHRVYTYEIEIRITTKIEEANEVTWRTFLKVDVKPFGFSGKFWTFIRYGSFYVDEKKKVALICDNPFSKAYVIGDDNYFKVVALGESPLWQHECSYVPSSVQIQKAQVHAGGKRKVRDY
ncbi:F-box/kelch-repeat protein [Raphanus sativus]|uniref:F-box protein At3g49510-like n=1 Tax=Raphanus sativus TaxID=3726 RepID=A0A6J0NS36_RAPSA|nr:F-box protein At3g49510-like [Raphanus sativus]KAJ4894048.1 F-box/kelch-repeat protein [Raphanus sativus]